MVRATLTLGAADVSIGGAMMAQSIGDATAIGSNGGAMVAASGGMVLEIEEEKDFVQLGKLEVSRDELVWIVDTGATSHMTGSRAAFIYMDAHVRGTVRSGDHSVTEIEGQGKVEFVYKNGEWQMFGEVLYNPKLSANIISVGRLDEDGYHVVIGSGKLVI
jgi:hypothetical protein